MQERGGFMKKTKVHYDKKSDILYFVLKSGPADYAEEVSDFVTVEYDEKGKPIGIEIIKASEILGKEFMSKSSHISV